MGKHDVAAMASSDAFEAFRNFVAAEEEVLALVQRGLDRDMRGSAERDVLVESRFDIDDRRPIDGFEMPHLHTALVNGRDRHPVQADGIGPVR